MKTPYLTAFVLALSSAAAHAQEVDLPRSDSVAAETVETPSSVGDFEGLEDELAVALDELSGTISLLANRLANDPELRVAAVRAASILVEVATVMVEEQSDVVEEALRRAADKVEDIASDAANDSSQ